MIHICDLRGFFDYFLFGFLEGGGRSYEIELTSLERRGKNGEGGKVGGETGVQTMKRMLGK